jgi:putative membrane protein
VSEPEASRPVDPEPSSRASHNAAGRSADAGPVLGPPEAGGWHRLHPLSPAVRLWRGLIALVIISIPALSGSRKSITTLIIEAVVFVVLLTLAVVSWLVTRWTIEDRTLRIETGLLRRSSKRFPLAQLQAIDVVQPGVARVLGLAELRLRLAGGAGDQGRLAYLPQPAAVELRARLLALAHGLADDVPAPPEQVLLWVPPGRLLASMALSGLGVVIVALIVTAVVLEVVSAHTLGVVVGAGFAAILALATTTWRQFNGAYELTVAEAPDGLRLRGGLLETTAETIPFGRVQAVRLTEPFMWRPWHWCRLEVDVAGRQRGRRENRAQARQLRAVLPVGSRPDAYWLLSRILPDAPTPDRRPPERVRLKSPLSYHWLCWGRDERCVVTVSGRIRRVTHWVPLAKVQSLRAVEGPVQRRLGLATIHVDTAGRAIDAALRDRSRAEVQQVLPELVNLARAARRRAA